MSQCETIVVELRKRGYRITPQRELIIRAISQSPRHITAEEVATQLQKHTQVINIATIYRTLDLLWQEGFACRSDLSEGKIVYAAVEHGPHIHLVCRKCNQVIDADSDALQSLNAELEERYGFDSDLDHFSIFGVCSDCREK